MANHIPNIVLHPQFIGTTDSAGFQGPIARPVSDDVHHFFTKIATEYDGDPIPRWENTHDSAVRPIFRVRSPDPFLTIFAIFRKFPYAAKFMANLTYGETFCGHPVHLEFAQNCGSADVVAIDLQGLFVEC